MLIAIGMIFDKLQIMINQHTFIYTKVVELLCSSHTLLMILFNSTYNLLRWSEIFFRFVFIQNLR